jgi:membrane protein YdbS with pleckstrin-like domain
MRGGVTMSDGATGARGSERIALNRAYAVISPDQITIKPARMGLVGPAIQALLTLAAVWAMATYINSLPLWLLMVLLTFVIVSGPIAVLGLVYNILGSAFLMERKKGTCRWQQGFLGLGLGTRELVPFPRIGSIEVTGNFEEEPLAEVGLERANTLAEALAEMSGSRAVPGVIPEWALLLDEDDDDEDDPEGEGDR